MHRWTAWAFSSAPGAGSARRSKVDALDSTARELGAAACTTHSCLCSPEGVATIRTALEDGTIGGALVAACSSLVKSTEFRFDPRKYPIERVSLREQCVWSHPAGEEDTQTLADDLVRMGYARLAKGILPKPIAETIERSVLVVGGGVAGLAAASAAAEMGHPVVVVESGDHLGGHLARLSHLVPDRPPYEALQPNRIADLIAAVTSKPDVRVYTSAKIRSITGQPGQFHVEIDTPSGGHTLMAGAIVQATGSRPYDAGKLGHLGYGASPNVVTASRLDEMLANGGVRRPTDGRLPGRIVFVQCAGSRDPQHLPYCSADCCGTTLRQVAQIHQANPEVETAVVYRDMRTPGQIERFYAAVQQQPGSMFTRGEVASISGNGTLKVRLKDSLLGDDVELQADLVVLATGAVPNSADGEAIRTFRDATKRSQTAESEVQRDEARKVAEQYAAHEGTEILNLGYRQGPDLPTLRHGFPDSHFICFPYETRRTGIYAAGSLRAPMDSAQATEDGLGAAMKAVQCINAAARGEAVHPRSGDVGVPDFFLQRCTQCKRCTEECPFGTLNEDEKGTPQLNVLRCRRCGICMGACPERIISFPDYSVDAVASMIKATERSRGLRGEAADHRPGVRERRAAGPRRRGGPPDPVEPLGAGDPDQVPRLDEHRVDRRFAVTRDRRRHPDRMQVRRRLPVPLRARLRAGAHAPGERPRDPAAAGPGEGAHPRGGAVPRRVRAHPSDPRRVLQGGRGPRAQPAQGLLGEV